MKRALLILLLCVFSTGVAIAEPAGGGKPLSVKTFRFKYKDADRAAAAVKTLVSPEGSMSIQPASNALVVTDRAENMKAITAALTEFDSAPRVIRFSVRLVSASKGQTPAVEPEVRDIGAKLAVLGYNTVEELGSANVEGREGEPGQIELAGGYRADFRFGELDAAAESIHINDFKVSRLQKDQMVQLYNASLNLQLGQPLIFGVTKTQGKRALFLMFVAQR